MRLRFQFGENSFVAELFSNPASDQLARMMPLELTIEDYAHNEKIAYLPQKLAEVEANPFSGEAIGDICYYAPWGNTVFYYDHYRYSRGLIRLGRIEGNVRPMLTRGTFPLRAELLS